MPASTLRRQSVTSNIFPEIRLHYRHGVRGFLTDHARVLLCVAHDPGMRLRDIATRLNITERSAHGIITDLTAAGYLVKQKDGPPQPLPGPGAPCPYPPAENAPSAKSWPSSRATTGPAS
jgi:hypothetical protein